MIALDLLQETIVISVFVAVMMIVVEYVNVWTCGGLNRVLQGSRARQYVLAALLGATPGCLGAYLIVAIHVQRGVTLGAVVAAMLATCGDELFVMLATFPVTALAMVVGLVVLAIFAGWLTDTVVGRFSHVDHDDCCEFVEDHTADCDCFPEDGVLSIWRRPRPERIVDVLALGLFVTSLIAGWIGPDEWEWERIAFVAVGGIGLLVLATASDPFFREHVWTHVVREHMPRVLLWIGGTLVVVALLEHFVDIRTLVADNPWIVLLVAVLVGIIPVSGPHLLFVTLFASGALPLSVLVANSAVQDGHGMLPLLAHSRRDFFVVKGINVLFGLAAGATLMALGL